MVVTVTPLVCWSDEHLAGGRKSFTLMKQAAQPRSRILAAGRKPMDRVVQLYHLARDQLTISIKRLGNATHIL
jgi:hypothetical protein